MDKVLKSTSALPLMLKFTSPQPMKVVKKEDCEISYDPINQITYFMGGGSSKKSKSHTSTKRTVDKVDRNFDPVYKQDHEYGSDD